MVTRLADGLWWVDLRGVNAYLVEDGETTLVDAGMPWHRRTLERELSSVVDSLESIDRVLVTHFDFDHVGALGRLSLDAPVYIGAADKGTLTGEARPDWTSAKGALQRVSSAFQSEVSLPVEAVSDGDTVGGFSAVHTPGHTPGHTCFVHEELSVAFLGDLVRESDGTFGVAPRWLNADHDEARQNVVAFSERAGDFEIGCPGHGRPVGSDAAGVLENYADTLRSDA